MTQSSDLLAARANVRYLVDRIDQAVTLWKQQCKRWDDAGLSPEDAAWSLVQVFKQFESILNDDTIMKGGTA